MSFVLPKLPYSFDALEPYIDAKTMEIHYTKHHQAYVDNLNNALKNYPELQKKSLVELIKSYETLPGDIAMTIRNNAGGHYNHSLFWNMMQKNGGGEPKGKVALEIKQMFGSFQHFKDEFSTGARQLFGSGWTWLAVDKDGRFTGRFYAESRCANHEQVYPKTR